jgi:hypothetical protein
MTQKEKILAHLQKHGSITDLDAYRMYAIRRLGARIWDLRSEGFLITSKQTKAKNRFGQETYFTTYLYERNT